MSIALSRRLLSAEARQGGKTDVGAELKRFFCEDGGALEDFVLNPGQVNLILQTPSLSAVVIVWGDGLRRYGHNHACEKVWTHAVRGSVLVRRSAEDDPASAHRVTQGTGHFSSDGCCGSENAENAENAECGHHFFGDAGAVSVHVYRTEVANVCCHPIRCSCTSNRKLVLCLGAYSVTDAERGKSVSAVCADARSAHLCRKSLRWYTNFRDLIELLHHEVAPLAPGAHHDPAHIAQISGLLGAVRISEAEYSRYLRFRDNAYTRNLVGYDVPAAADGQHKAKFTVLVLCWAAGQMSPIHDHAGSSCWVKVLQGQVREVRYDASQSPPRVKSDVTLGAQDTCYINDTQGVHSMGNPCPDQVAVSLHVYAPPYILCKLFEQDSCKTRVGSMATARIPSNPFPYATADGVDGDQPPTGSVAAPTAIVPSGCPASAAVPRPLPLQRLELAEFYSAVREAVRGGGAGSGKEMGALLGRLSLREHEWREFVHFDAYRYTRSLVALDSDFSLMVLCWNSSQGTPIHSHGRGVCSWAKVLRGTVQLKQYAGTPANPELLGSKVYSEGAQVACGEFDGMHVLQNASDDEPAVTLHLYSPPLVQMAYLDSGGVDRVIPVVHSATSAGKSTCRNGGDDPIANCDAVVRRTRLSSAHSDTSGTTGSLASGSNPQQQQQQQLEEQEDADPEVTGAQREDEDEELTRTLSFFEQEQDSTAFTNLNALTRFVVIRGITHRLSRQQVLRALERVHVNPDEWAEFMRAAEDAAPACDMSTLVGRGPHFRILLRRLGPGAVTRSERPAHASWVKVLEGELLEKQALEGVQVHVGSIKRNAVAFLSDRLECALENVSRTACAYLLQLVDEH